MTSQKVTRIDSKPFSGCPVTQSTPSEHTGQLDKLLRGLSDGEMPNFLEMMAALSEIAYEMTGDDGPCIECQR